MGIKNVSWTDGRVKGFITSVIRGGFRRWPPKFNVLSAAKKGKKVNAKTGRVAEHYECFTCKEAFPAKEVQVDHIAPVVDPKVGFVDWDTFISRLFCEAENLQVLCKPCHLAKTKLEKEERKK